MIDELYQEKLLEHYRHPSHYGLKDNCGIDVKGDNPLCGDNIVMRVKLENGIVSDVCFDSNGCVVSRASASIMSEYVIGKTKEEVNKLTVAEVLAIIGVPISQARVKCALLFIEILKKAIN
ncbi:MAG: iron-sulfur cluster assembly scaffold protein [bacterium]